MTSSIQAAVQTTGFSRDTWRIWVLRTTSIIVSFIMNVLPALRVERHGLARVQTCLGPNRVGPLGLGQIFADVVRLLVKKDLWLKSVGKITYLVIPFVDVVYTFTVMAAAPMGPNVSILSHLTSLQLADSPIAALSILMIAALGEYGLVLGGWSAHSTLPFYGSV